MSQFKMEMGLMGEVGKQHKGPTKRIVKSLHHFMQLLEMKNLSGELKEEVIKHVKKYPEGALDQVYVTIDKVILVCQNKVAARRPEVIPEPEQEIVEVAAAEYKPFKPIVPQVQRKTLFDDAPTVESASAPALVAKAKEPVKSKWSTASAAEIDKMRNTPPPLVLPSMGMNQKPQKKETNPMESMTPEQATEFIRNKFAINPPREGNPKRNEDD